MSLPTDKPVVWCLLDARPGHRNQVLGLADAIQRHVPATVEHVNVAGVTHGILSGFSPRTWLPKRLPQLIIGAGHSTHVPLLQLGQRFSAKTIVLMKPTFPLWLFDVCVVPDVYPFRRIPDNVVVTTGVLNRIQPSDQQRENTGLVLAGGLSAHHQWSDDLVMQQLTDIVRHSPGVTWQIAASRRTPASFIDGCRTRRLAGDVVLPDEVAADWLPQQLSRSGTVWVTEDSVSMMYEAVTSGAATGVMELSRIRHNRATQCVDLLRQSKDVTAFSDWRRTRQLHSTTRRLSEADRCAEEIINRRLLCGHGTAAVGRAA